MVGDDTQSHVCLVIGMVSDVCNLADMLHDVLNGVHFKEVVHALHDASQTFQTHTRINVLVFHFGVMSVAVAVELAEYQVPDFDITVAVTANAASWLSAALFLATVEIDFRTRTTWARAVFPEVIFSAQPLHVRGCNTHVLCPEVICFIIVFKDGNIQLIDWHFQFFGEEFPCPFDCLLLEVVAEREVAQHFKIGAVTGSLSNPFDIRCPDALLTGGDPYIRRNSLSQEVLFQRCHTGVDEQQALVALRNQGKAWQPGMVLAFKERKVFFSQFV